MEWLILAALIVIGVGSNAEATVPLELSKPPLTEIHSSAEILTGQKQVQLKSTPKVVTNFRKRPSQAPAPAASLDFERRQKEVVGKLSNSYQWLVDKLELHGEIAQDPEFVSLGAEFGEIAEAARQIKPSHLVLALRYIRNRRMSTEEIIEMIMNWPPKRLEHLLSKRMREEFDLLVKALQKLPRETLLRGICFIRSSKGSSRQLAALLTSER